MFFYIHDTAFCFSIPMTLKLFLFPYMILLFVLAYQQPLNYIHDIAFSFSIQRFVKTKPPLWCVGFSSKKEDVPDSVGCWNLAKNSL